MTSDDLRATIARLRALIDKATPAPWELAGDDPAHIVVLDEETGSIVGHIAEAGRDDAELIAALRNAAQDLLDAAERAQKMEKALRDIMSAPIPPHIGPAHELQNIARRAISRLYPVVPT